MACNAHRVFSMKGNICFVLFDGDKPIMEGIFKEITTEVQGISKKKKIDMVKAVDNAA